MPDRYWVGGTANWDGTAGTKWALTSGGFGGQTVPTAADDVYFDAASGASTVTVSAAAVCRNLSFSGFTGTFAGTSTLAISGGLTLGAGMTRTYTGVVTFDGTSSNVLTSNGVILNSNLTFNGVGGAWQLADSLTTGSTRTVTLTNGTLDINSQSFTAGAFSSTNSNARTIAFGASGKFIATRDSVAIWNTSTSTNLTVTGNAVVEASYSGAVGTRTFNGGATSEANSVSLTVTAGSDTLVAQNNVKNLNLSAFAGTLSNSTRVVFGGLTLSASMTLSAGALATSFQSTATSNTITVAGKTLDFPLTFAGAGGEWAFQDALTQGSSRAFTFSNGTVRLKNGATSTVGAFATSGATQKFLSSSLAGSQATLSQATGTVNASFLTVQDIAATGGATWDAYADQSNVNAGNNTGWNFGASPTALAYEVPYEIRSFTQPRRF